MIVQSCTARSTQRTTEQNEKVIKNIVHAEYPLSWSIPEHPLLTMNLLEIQALRNSIILACVQGLQGPFRGIQIIPRGCGSTCVIETETYAIILCRNNYALFATIFLLGGNTAW